MKIYKAAAQADKHIVAAPPVKNGRVELIIILRSKVLPLNIIDTEVFRKYPPLNKTNTLWFCYLNADNKTILI